LIFPTIRSASAQLVVKSGEIAFITWVESN